MPKLPPLATRPAMLLGILSTRTAKITLIATTCVISCGVVTRRLGGMYVAMIVVATLNKKVEHG